MLWRGLVQIQGHTYFLCSYTHRELPTGIDVWVTFWTKTVLKDPRQIQLYQFTPIDSRWGAQYEPKLTWKLEIHLSFRKYFIMSEKKCSVVQIQMRYTLFPRNITKRSGDLDKLFRDWNNSSGHMDCWSPSFALGSAFSTFSKDLYTRNFVFHITSYRNNSVNIITLIISCCLF